MEYLTFSLGFAVGATLMILPTIIILNRGISIVKEVPEVADEPPEPSPVLMKRPGPKRKPKAIDDKKAWEMEQEKA